MTRHAIGFIQDLAVIMVISGIITIIFHRLKQPVVLGYIIAGIIIGPYTPPFSYIHDQATIKILAELGVIFLMFSLGLEFDLHKLKQVGLTAVITAFIEISLMIWLGYEIGLMFKWSVIDAIFLGAILAISSTTIIVKALEELGMKQESFAQLIFGILIIEDIFAIAILALLSSIAITGTLDVSNILVTTINLSSFLVISLVLGILLVPRLLAYIAKFENKEMLLISVLGCCFGFCLLAVKLDFSVALGAFISGAIIAESKQLKIIENLIVPLRDMFSAIFFVSVGLLFDPKVLVEYAFPILVITIAVVFGKVITSTLGVLITGRDAKTAMRVGMGLAQIGEFSFIIASLGITLNVTGKFLFPIAVAVSAITTFLTPYLIRYSGPLTKKISLVIPRRITFFIAPYKAWRQMFHSKEKQTAVSKEVYRSLFQIVVNFFIVIAIFLSCTYVAKAYLSKMLLKITSVQLEKTFIWSAALIFSLPFLLAIYGKIKALSLLTFEVLIKINFENYWMIKIRNIIAEIISISILTGVMLFISFLCAEILPPFQFQIALYLAILLFVAFLYPWIIKFHSKLQISFLESMRNDN